MGTPNFLAMRRVEEGLVQVVHVLENGELARDNYVVDCAQVLGVLGKTDTTGVRNDGHTELLGHETGGRRARAGGPRTRERRACQRQLRSRLCSGAGCTREDRHHRSEERWAHRTSWP